MEQIQMNKFCIDLDGVMLPDAIAAVVEAWYEAQSVEADQSVKYYNIDELQKVLNRSRAFVYRVLNIDKYVFNLPFDPAKLNHEYRVDKKDSIRVSSDEIKRWKNESQRLSQIAAQQNHATKAQNENNLDCKERVLDYVCRLTKAGLLTNGDKMPSLRDLSHRLDMHRNTAAKIYEELEADGIIVAKLGSGFYIANASKFIPANAF
jgi:predicted transcriptional regulator